MSASRTFRLKLFGSPAITSVDGAVLTGPAAQRHRLALLALLALGRGRGRGRETLKGHLWPERDTEHARQLLNQAVYQLRKALGENSLVSGIDDLRLDPEVVGSDVTDFESALERGDLRAAVAWYQGPFLDGFFLAEAAEFDEWVDRERTRLASAYGRALEKLAEAAERAHDAALAAEWWAARAAHDPYDSRVALRLMQALEASGNRTGALQHAALHQRLLRQEFGAEPDPDVLALAERLRTSAPVRPPRFVAGDGRLYSSSTGTPLPAAASAADPEPGAASTPPATPPPGRGRRVVRWGAAVLLLGAALFGASRIVATRAATPPPLTSARPPSTRNVAAYDLYRRGTDPALLRNDSSARAGLDYLQEAIALDPTYAAGWAGLARMYSRVASDAAAPDQRRYLGMAENAANTAVALDDALAEAHATLALIRLRSFDAESAERHLRRAIELDQTLALANEWLVMLHLWTGRPDLALVQAERAVELDPQSPIAYAGLAVALLHNDRCDDALGHLERLTDLQPPLLRARPLAALCHARNQKWAEAIALLRPQAELGEPHAQALLGYMLARSGHAGEARRIRSALVERWETGEGGNPFQIAVVDVGLGDLDRAFARIDTALEVDALHGVAGLTLNLVILGILVEDLQGDPRFEALRDPLGLELR